MERFLVTYLGTLLLVKPVTLPVAASNSKRSQ